MSVANGPGRASAGKLEVGIVRNQDDVFAAMAVRAVVMCGEMDRRLTEEFDGTDMNATLILARVGGEPVGTIRVRWFAGFAKVERVAVLRAHRSLRVFNALARFAFDHVREKGYARYCGHALPNTVKLWQRFGAEEVPGAELADYGRPDLASVVMMGDLEPTAHSDQLINDHALLVTPEHRWPAYKQAKADAQFIPMAAE